MLCPAAVRIGLGEGHRHDRVDVTSGSDTLASAASRVPASRRRALLVLVPVVVVAAAAGASYLRGGARLTGTGGSVSSPVTIGEEFHTMVDLNTEGETLELVSARAVGASPDLRVEVSLVKRGDAPQIGASRGPLPDGYRVLDLSGHRLRTGRDGDLVLDLRLIATSAGTHEMRAVAVTYRAGSLRERTAVLPAPVCLSAADDWTAAPEAQCEVFGIGQP